MKKTTIILFSVLFAINITSCVSVKTIKTDKEIAGYTRNNKKEFMAQEIIQSKPKTFLATP